MIKIRNSNNQTIVTHTYGASRMRLITQEGNESSTNLTYYAWEGGSVIAEYGEGAGNVLVWLKNYIYMGGTLLATHDKTVSGETTQFNHSDQLGTRLVTDPGSGTYFEQSTLPFGNALESESSGSIKQRFTTYDRSASTGLNYAVNRFYDSSQGRFTTVDPIKMSATSLTNPQSLNLYAYTANDPINRTDPNGLDWGANNPWAGIYINGTVFTGGSGTSINTAWIQFFQGLFGSLFGGPSYAGRIVPSFLNNPSVFVSPTQLYGLPNAGNVSITSSPSDNNNDDTDCKDKVLTKVDVSDSGDGATSKRPYMHRNVVTDFNAAMKEIVDGSVMIGFNELFRPYAVQVQYWDMYQANIAAEKKGKAKPYPRIAKAARNDGTNFPGTSNHGAGYAFDISIKNRGLKNEPYDPHYARILTKGPNKGKTVEQIFNKYNFFRDEPNDENHFNYKTRPSAADKLASQNYFRDCLGDVY